MKNSHIRWVVFLGVLSIVGIIFSQVYLVQKAVENNQEEFNHQVQMALRNVVESLCELNGNDITNDPIDQVSKIISWHGLIIKSTWSHWTIL